MWPRTLRIWLGYQPTPVAVLLEQTELERMHPHMRLHLIVVPIHGEMGNPRGTDSPGAACRSVDDVEYALFHWARTRLRLRKGMEHDSAATIGRETSRDDQSKEPA